MFANVTVILRLWRIQRLDLLHWSKPRRFNLRLPIKRGAICASAGPSASILAFSAFLAGTRVCRFSVDPLRDELTRLGFCGREIHLHHAMQRDVAVGVFAHSLWIVIGCRFEQHLGLGKKSAPWEFAWNFYF